MVAYVLNHPRASLVAALLIGMLLEWLLELFFLRRRLFDLEHELGHRERDVAALRHEQARSLTELRNKLTELDSTQKAKLALEHQMEVRERELAQAREGLHRAEQSQQAERARAATAEARWHEVLQRANLLERQVTDLELDLRGERSAREGWLLEREELRAALLTEQMALGELRTVLRSQSEESDRLMGRVEELDREFARGKQSENKMRDALESREAMMSGFESRLAEAESERASLSNALGATDNRLKWVQTQCNQMESDLKDKVSRLANTEKELVSWREAAERARRDRSLLDGSLKKCEADLAEAESELAVLSESHKRLEAALAAATTGGNRPKSRPRAAGTGSSSDKNEPQDSDEELVLNLALETQTERPGNVDDSEKAGVALERMVSDLELLTRERNDLAAELATLKATTDGDGGGDDGSNGDGDGDGESDKPDADANLVEGTSRAEQNPPSSEEDPSKSGRKGTDGSKSSKRKRHVG